MTNPTTPTLDSTMKDFVSALIDATQDPIRLFIGKDTVEVTDDLEATLAQAGGAPVYLSPVTTTAAVPFLYSFTENAQPDQWQDDVIQPTAVLFKDGGLICAYALETAVAQDAALDTLAERMNGHLDDAVPAPGANGWELVHLDASTFYPLATLADAWADDAAPALVTATAPWAAEDHGTLNDARLLTPFRLDDPRYAQEMIVSIGGNAESKVWAPKPMPVGTFIDMLSRHREDKKKDGVAFVLAEIVGNQRKKAAVTRCYGVGLDIDVGVSGAVIDEALIKLGCLAVRYTTHSHGKSSTKLLKDRIAKWCKKHDLADGVTQDSIIRFLREESRWDESIISTVEYAGDVHDPEGFMVQVDHIPMPKHRVVLPLTEPFVPTTVAKTHDEGMKMWGDVCRALAKALGDLALDRSAVDPSRLFYFPRHVAARPFETRIVGGDLLDWKTLDLDGASAEPGSFEALLLAEVQTTEKTKSKSTTDEGRGLGRWSIKAAGGFQIVDLIKDHAEDRVRTNGAHKIDIECPFDEEHSDPGNPEDKGCFAVNAGDGPSDIFTIKCQHDSCSQRTNLDHLGKMLKDAWFDADAIDDPNYNALLDEGADLPSPEAVKIATEDAARAVYEEMLDALDKDSNDDDIMDCVRAIVEASLPAPRKLRVEARMKKALGMTQRDIDKLFRSGKVEATKALVREGAADPDYPLPAFLGNTTKAKRGDRVFICRTSDSGDEPLCTRFTVAGGGVYPDRLNTRDVEIAFENEFGKRETIRMVAGELGSKRDTISILRGKGMAFATENGETFAHRALMELQPSCTTFRDRCGWLEDGSFMMPTGVHLGGEGDVRLTDERRVNAKPTAGSLEGWKAGAKAACNSNSPSLHAGLLAGLAGPLTGLTGQATLVLAFTGTSTEGKTWRQMVGVAASGPPKPGVGQMKSMNSTEGALEVPLERGSCTIAAFDELHHAPAKVVQNLVFRASGEQGRARLKQSGSAGLTREWRGGVVTLSTETGLAQRLRQEGENLAGGATVRMIEVDVTVGRLSQDDWDTANKMLKNYGWPFPIFIEEVRRQGYVEDPAALEKRVRAFVSKLDGADTPMALRAATAVGYLCVAGEIAKEAGLLPASFNIDKVGRTLWEGAMGSDMKAENPVQRAIDTLLESLNTRRSEVWDENALRDPLREIIAWKSQHGGAEVYCVRASLLGKLSGGAADERALKKALIDLEIAIPYVREKKHGDKVVTSKGAVWDKWKAPVGKVGVIVLKASAVEGLAEVVPTTV